jgi:hypothetical protein
MHALDMTGVLKDLESTSWMQTADEIDLSASESDCTSDGLALS